MKLCQNHILAGDGERAVCLAFDGLCDAVVMLNDNLTLALPSPRFAGLLLLHDAVRSLSGRAFTDFLIPEDVDRFKAFMSEPPEARQVIHESGHASTHRLQVQCKTNTAGPVKFEVHHVSISRLPSIGAGIFHALGICELGDTDNQDLSASAVLSLHRPLRQSWAARTPQSSITQYSDNYLKDLEAEVVQSPSQRTGRLSATLYGAPNSKTDDSGTGSDSACTEVGDALDIEFRWKRCQVAFYGEPDTHRFTCELSQAEALEIMEPKWETFCMFIKDLHDSATEKMMDLSESLHKTVYRQKVSLSLTTTLTAKQPIFASGTRNRTSQSTASRAGQFGGPCSPTISCSSSHREIHSPSGSEFPRRLSL